VNAEGLPSDPIQLANVLKSFAELRDSKAISNEEYDGLKARVLAAMERRLPQGKPEGYDGSQDAQAPGECSP
jgi:hypothetical protein